MLRMPNWLRRTLIALAALAVLVAAGAAWLVARFDAERSKALAIEWMREHRQRELAIDGPLRLTLLPLGVSVAKVRLSEHAKPKEAFATIDEAALSVKLWPLLTQQRVSIDNVSARGVRVQYLRDAQGRRNIDDLIGAQPEPAGPASQPGSGAGDGIGFDADAIEIADVALTVRDAMAGIDGRFEFERLKSGRLGAGTGSPLSLAARVQLREPKIDARATLDARMALEMAPGQPVRLRLADARITLLGQGLRVAALDAKLEAASLSFDGAAHALSVERAKLALNGERLGIVLKDSTLALERLDFDPSRRTLALTRLDARLKGRMADGAFDARLGWPALKVADQRLEGGALDGELELDGARRKLALALSSQAPSGSFERIDVPGLRVRVDGMFDGQQVKGELAGKLALKPDPWAATLDAMQLSLAFSAPSLPPLQLRAQGGLRADAKHAAAKLSGTFNEQRFELQADAALAGERPDIDAKARFDGLDLTRFVPARAAASAASAPSPADAPVDLSALQAFDARLDLRAASLVYPPYRIDDAQLAATVRAGVLDVSRLSGRSWGGRFSSTARADANTRQLGLGFDADEIDLRALLGEVAKYDRLEGRGRLSAKLHTRGASVSQLRAALDGRAAFTVRDGALRGINLAKTLRQWRSAVALKQDARQAGNADERTDFSELSASFDIANGVARSKDLVAKSPFLRVGGEGSIDLVRSRIDYLANATVTSSDQGQGGPELALLKGITVPIEVSGPLDEVDYRVRWSVVSAQLLTRPALNVVGGTARTAGDVIKGLIPGHEGASAAAPAASGASAPAGKQRPEDRLKDQLKGLFGK